METAILRVDYDDVNQNTYTGLRLSIGSNKTSTLFDTGDVVVDWWDYIIYVADSEIDHITHSSSCDHFFMDGYMYEIKYLHMQEKRFATDEEYGSIYSGAYIAIWNRAGWTYDQWHQHLYNAGRHKHK